MSEEILLTQEGLDKLEAELETLVAVKRKEISERLKEARSYGDLSENAEYDVAQEDYSAVEERIQQLEGMIRSAKIINEDEVSLHQVNVGLLVKVKDESTGEVLDLEIVGATEADPFAEPVKISNYSPIGAALIGKSKGETVEVSVPDGIVAYTIIDISR